MGRLSSALPPQRWATEEVRARRPGQSLRSLTAPHAWFFFSSPLWRIGGPEVGSAKSKSGPAGSPIPFYAQLYFLSAASHPCRAAAAPQPGPGSLARRPLARRPRTPQRQRGNF
ncbi:hypothetical protein PVAP13_5KG581707 [Panicum virgatum]|uniref:Uncharacterized protein n=1 Tax=Panicum virgatum TaxID=38727 RepID=A0A8T0SWA1_PANVG|nr:hypothetical protein PVAP13_5KG581707 [Panicum virgatum]